MHSQFLIVAILAAYGVAIPLNINLGAYSPALVVGDGEISFGGKADVSNLMNALEGAAVGGAAANAGTGTKEGGAAATPSTAPKAANANGGVVDGQQAAQIASLQGMGKEIAPRVVKLQADKEVAKRDLTGFNAALKYATDAIKITPQVELGTEAAGVGILQRPGITAAAAAGAAPRAGAAGGAAAKRDLPTRKMKTTVTTMFVRGGPAPAGAEKRSIAEAALSKREPSPGIDGVNLNMADGQVAELTFVETRAVDEDEAEDEDDDDE